jgi:TalC/MipB family fructose-6-phosphate aldolase
MEFLLDTIHIEDIKKYNDIIALAGVTSNPTIVKKEGKVDFFKHMNAIRDIIGKDKTLHVQAVGRTTEAIVEDAHTIRDNIDDQVYVKVPTNAQGLAAMKILKAEGFNITATAIYSEFQARLAIEVGADYLAPYFNRMVNMGLDAKQILANIQATIDRQGSHAKILAASFHTVGQVNDAFEVGAAACTMGADILASALGNPAIEAAVDGFTNDWESIYGESTTISSFK